MRTHTSPLPLAVFRICFGLLMLVSTVRFWLKGWIEQLYLKPTFFFTYYGFEWVLPLPYPFMYGLFFCIGLAALLIALGLFYRIASVLFFLSFTYIELIDKTNYLNHYYLVSLLSFLLIFIPANCCLSLDIFFKIREKQNEIPNYYLFIIKLQLALVYFFAGIAKINSDWLLEALPMRIWLPTKSDMPLIGSFFAYPLTAYLFSWAGMLFDVSIGFLLWWKRTSIFAYLLVLVFHLLTALLFPQIGMFPFMMILFTLIFPLSYFGAVRDNYAVCNIDDFFCNIILNAKQKFYNSAKPKTINLKPKTINQKLFIFYFLLQFIIPFRYLLYPNSLFWSEEGYRFSWRVMLMEKAGTVFFVVKKPDSGQEIHINNRDYLTPLQEKMMSTQPDMILQFAHFLAQTYAYSPTEKVQVFASAYVSLNGRGSRPFIDEKVDLAMENEGFATKKWVLTIVK